MVNTIYSNKYSYCNDTHGGADYGGAPQDHCSFGLTYDTVFELPTKCIVMTDLVVCNTVDHL